MRDPDNRILQINQTAYTLDYYFLYGCTYMSIEKSSHFLKNYVLSGIVTAALIGSLIAAPYYSLNNLLLVQAQAPPSSTTTGEMADITLGGMSTEGSVEVTVNWTVADIGQPNTFSFQFFDPDMQPIQQPIYSIELLQNNQTVPGTLRQEQTSSVQEYTFNQTGSYTLRIHDMQDRRATDVINIPLQVNATTPGSNP
jgi:hypothetical protein